MGSTQDRRAPHGLLWTHAWRSGPRPASLPSAPAATGLLRTAQPRVFLQKGAVDPARFRSEAPSGAQGFHTSPTGPGPCPVTGGWMLASAGASQSWAVCADGASCLVSCDCPSSRVRLFSSSGQIPGQRAPGSQVRARRTVGAEPALSHGDLGCRQTVQPWPSAWGPSLQGRLLTCVTSDPR